MGTTMRKHFGEHPRRKRRGVQRILVLSAVFLGNAIAQQTADPTAGLFVPDTPGASHAATDLRVSGPNPDARLYPITALSENLTERPLLRNFLPPLNREEPTLVTAIRLAGDTEEETGLGEMRREQGYD